MCKTKNLPEVEKEISRNWHPNYVEYTEMIVSHPNYRGLPYERDPETNRVKWVATGKSPQGQARLAWWNEQCKMKGIPIQKGCYALISRLIHPTKEHVCQCCGRSLFIYYLYPTKNTIKSLKKKLPLFAKVGDVAPADYNIFDIIDKFCRNTVEINYVAKILDLPAVQDAFSLKILIRDQLANGGTKKLSPGAMSNCPDRLEGYHSDGLCCRERSDKGRHTDNMRTYTQDRRAYENWSDGNYRLANRLMGEFKKGNKRYICPKCGKMKKMTADHIGPISLGFCHSGHFTPLCQSCNSAKNNRFYKEDVDTLIRLENAGETVISWHSVYIWELLKHRIKDDISAKLASSLMAEYHQNVIYAFSIIYKNGGEELLRRHLHPEYSLFDYRFENFDPFHLDQMKVIESSIDSKNARSNQERYQRVAFKSLEEYQKKHNRRHELLFSEDSDVLKKIAELSKNGNIKEGDDLLLDEFYKLAVRIVQTKWSA